MLEDSCIGFVVCGSHCNLDKSVPIAEELATRGAEVIPITSSNMAATSTRFGEAEMWLRRLNDATGREPVYTVPEVEPLGPTKKMDVVVVCPCTGNTMAKLANAITDSPALMAIKGQLRNAKPVVLTITSNDVLGLNARNLGRLLATKNVYFVPFGQDNPDEKLNSVTSNWDLVVPTVEAALEGRQLQPVLLQYHGERYSL